MCAAQADAAGNLYTGANTEDTPTIVEAAAFRHGIVMAQVNEIVDELPRVDIPGSWVDLVVQADRPFALEPLFTRDPRADQRAAGADGHDGDPRHLRAPRRHQRSTTASASTPRRSSCCCRPTASSLGLKGKICRNWALNPHPTLIPAIESGWVESVHCFGSEVGMEDYVRARPDVFFIGSDGSLRSNRVLCQLAGQYGVDLFIGSTLQMDGDANSSTVTLGRLAGFGGAPNMGHDPHGRRHSSPAWLDLISAEAPVVRGRKLVVQLVRTVSKSGAPALVESLDAVAVGKRCGMPIAPVMIYGDDVSHVVTEVGIAYLYKAQGLEERRAALAAIAGNTPIGARADPARTAGLRGARPGGVAGGRGSRARRGPTARCWRRAASTIWSRWSGGLYQPPERFR